MTKALLVMDMPLRCRDCELHKEVSEYNELGNCYCGALIRTDYDKAFYFHSRRVPKFCPLKLMPNKKIVKEIRSMNDIVGYSINQLGDIFTAHVELQTETLLSLGYNKCIDEILGEEE